MVAACVVAIAVTSCAATPVANSSDVEDATDAPTTTHPGAASIASAEPPPQQRRADAETVGGDEPAPLGRAARSDRPLEVYARAADPRPWTTLAAHTDLGTPRVVAVLDGPVDGWLEVALPIRPNGSKGWVRAADVQLFDVDRHVEVDLSDRRLVVSDHGGPVLETDVAIGGPGSPTPVGSFYITDSVRLTDPTGPWGPHAFGLSAYSDTITEFNGGDGIIGIHGTNRPSSIGSNRSLGCVRVPNEVAVRLSELLSAGVPVEIVR